MADCVVWVEAHKDFFLAIGALLSPFAAVFIGLQSSKRQAIALLKSTRMQIRASALRDYRQRNVEKLREEIAAEIFYVSQMRYKQQQVGLDDAKLSGRSDTYVHPHLLLRNASAHGIVVNATVYGRDESGHYAQWRLEPVKLESQSIIHVDLEAQRHGAKSTLADGVAGWRLTYKGGSTERCLAYPIALLIA